MDKLLEILGSFDIAKILPEVNATVGCIVLLARIVTFFVPYVASGFAACGKLFSSLFGVDYVTAMVLSAVVIILYCTLGGFLAARLDRQFRLAAAPGLAGRLDERRHAVVVAPLQNVTCRHGELRP